MQTKFINKYNKYLRNYYTIDNDKSKTMTNYYSNIQILIDNQLNDVISKTAQYGKIRIMSYNVRYFTNLNNEPTIKDIVDIILTNNPHILFLQEITLGQNKFYDSSEVRINFDNELNRLFHYYQVISVCSSPPGFYMTMYGNMVLINKEYLTKLSNIKNQKYSNIIKNTLCDATAPRDNKCFLNQQVFTYNNVPKRIIQDYDELGKIIYQEKTNENKCFIKISLLTFDVICVHLDAYNSDDRIKQLDDINKQITRPTVIMGDFNFFNVNDFIIWKNLLMNKIFIQLIFDRNNEYKLSQSNKAILDHYHKIIHRSIQNSINDNEDIIGNIIIDSLIVKDYNKIITDYKSQKITLNQASDLIIKKCDYNIDDLDFISDKLYYEHFNDKYNSHNIDPILLSDINDRSDLLITIFKRIDDIEKMLLNLNIFFSKKSSSIFENKEHNYCTNILNWSSVDPTTTINFSQWSGTRVDTVYFAKFSENIDFNYYFYYTLAGGSDHLPLFIDLTIDDTELYDSLNLTKINRTTNIESYINTNAVKTLARSNNNSQLNANPQLAMNSCAKYKSMKHIKISRLVFEKTFYNGQPCDYESFDWVIDGVFTKLSDPYLSAGSSDLALGREGVYLTNSIDYIGNIAHTITYQYLKNLISDPSGIYYAFLLFSFIYVGPDVTTINIGSNVTMNDIAFKECYDKAFDIITRSADPKNFIYKIPERNVQSYLKLKSVGICSDIIDDNTDSWKEYKIMNIHNYQVSDDLRLKLKQVIIDKKPIKIKDLQLDEKITTSVYMIINMIYIINSFSKKSMII